MKQVYRKKLFTDKSLYLIGRCDEIIQDYQSQGFVLTLRQLYYQLVSKDIIPNVERSYKNLSTLVTDARLAGMLDWDAIEDRGRQPKTPNEYANLSDLVEAALYSYRLPRWSGQDRYVELWVEKDALAGVLAPIARQWHVTLAVNKGYSSASAMRAAALRFIEHQDEQECFLLYLGDHDPSGEDMVRDIRDRLETFEAIVHVRKIGLTIEQVRQYNPPPNPAKLTDPRAKGYIEKYGDKSWEVDALPPTVLKTLIETNVRGLVDQRRLNKVVEQEESDKRRLRTAVASLQEDE